MYAVIESGGKQYRLSQGDLIDLELLEGQVGEEIVFDEVLLLNDGEDAFVGAPRVSGARVVGEIVEQKKGDKVVVFKFKRRKMYRRKRGHRQLLTRVKIKEIDSGTATQSTASSEKTKKPASAAGSATAKRAPASEEKASEKSETKE